MNQPAPFVDPDFFRIVARLRRTDRLITASRFLDALASGRRIWIEELALPGDWDGCRVLRGVWLVTALGAALVAAGQTWPDAVRAWH